MQKKNKQILFLIFVFFLSSQITAQNVENKGKTSPENMKDPKMEWFRDAKFGMFIHWGPYSQLAGEWENKKLEVGKIAEWIMKYLQIPVEEYRELAGKMSPDKFNAVEWVKLAKQTGMKYIVITAKHHDGFAMYDSGNQYNISDWSGFNRDPLQELAKACGKADIKFGVYYSHREDWDHPGGYGNNWDYDNDWGQDIYHPEKFPQYLEEKAKPQVRELLTQYGPIAMVWFDRGMYTRVQGMEFVKLVRKLQPDALINSRVGHYNKELLGDFQEMSDKGIPPGGLDEYFQTPQTLNETWGYSKFDTLWKSPEEVILQLIQVVSRGGNYLLNIGPKGDGSIPKATLNIFKEVGKWVNRNEMSIYGTSANPLGELDWGYCTQKENKLFLFVRNWNKGKMISIDGLKNKIIAAYPLVNPSLHLPVIQKSQRTNIELIETEPDNPISVIVLEMDGKPDTEPPIVIQQDSGKIELDYMKAITYGSTMTRFNRKGGFHISKWKAPDDKVEWRMKIDKPGNYKIAVSYSAEKPWGGKPYEIKIDQSIIEVPVVPTIGIFEYHSFPVGYVSISEPGEYSLIMHPKVSGDSYFMHLQSVTLKPSKKIKQKGWGIN